MIGSSLTDSPVLRLLWSQAAGIHLEPSLPVPDIVELKHFDSTSSFLGAPGSKPR